MLGSLVTVHQPTPTTSQHPVPMPQGIEAAVRVALADAGAVPGDVRHVNAHASSTPRGDLAEGKMLRRIFGTDPVVTSTKGVTGHLLGAAGAVEAIHTILAVEHQTVPPTANLDSLDPQLDINVPCVAKSIKIGLALSNSFGFGGQNAILAVAPA
jgi:3-oxoacyl-[acyl-carrier-protein] synthase II